MKQIDIADLDCIYLTYDEPQKEEFWVRIQNMVPWARRVDGVMGSDAAHKACAKLSQTDRFITVDGDNTVREEFFNQEIDFDANQLMHLNGDQPGDTNLTLLLGKFKKIKLVANSFSLTLFLSKAMLKFLDSATKVSKIF